MTSSAELREEKLNDKMANSGHTKNKKNRLITDYIDFNLSGRNYDYTNLSLAPFVAGFLQEIIASSCFKSVIKPLQEQIKHLSFLVHLACRFEDFETVFGHYKVVEHDLEAGLTSWKDENYFRSWEQRILTQIFFSDHIADDPEQHNGENGFNAFEPKIEVDTNSNFDILDKDCYENGDIKFSDEEYIPEKDIKYTAHKAPAKKRARKRNCEQKQSCPYCQQTVTSLDWHIKMHHVDKSNMEVDPEHLEDLNMSKKFTSGKELFESESCTVIENSKEEFKSTKKVRKKNEISCDSKKSLCCNSCDFSSKHQKRYDKHMFEKHEQTLCSICGMNFETFESFTMHIEAHMPEKCDVCKKCFKNKDFLKKHVDSTHNRTAKEMCPVCGKIYKNVANHVRIAHEYMTKQCPHCPYSSKISTDLNRHIQRTHTEDTVTTCPYCAKTTKNIKRHLKINKCDKPEEKVFAHIKCDRCDKTFSSKEHMKRHIKRIHDKILDIHCLQCDYKTYSNFNLRIHVTRVHEGKQLKQSCPYCQQTVISLDWHIKMYHVEKANSKVEVVDPVQMESVMVGMNGNQNQSISIPTSYLSS
eukprot:GFUD01017512.1.p1 GENE.GFUD01017512.1~~GFUD01017512.1.p1  ORF type:complete len:584 (+),score=127.38 GFUD01017512.1:160-1911(+)